MTGSEPLRVAFVAGTLGQGGAEKQLVYQVRALREAGVVTRVFSLTRGEHFESALAELDGDPRWIGRYGSPAVRLANVARHARAFRPHVVQAAHFFVNGYAAVAGRAAAAVSLACGRGDFRQDLADTGRWGRPLLASCDALVVNSRAAAAQAVALGRDARCVHVLPNVIDLEVFDRAAARGPDAPVPRASDGATIVAGVGSFVPAKRFDLFVRAVAAARRSGAAVEGWLVGDGPGSAALHEVARAEGVLEDGVHFLGRRDDVPALLARSDVLMLTSDTEGFPNVLLEAMAAGLPVVTTAAGDAASVVVDGATGLVAAVGDHAAAARALCRLAGDAELRRRWGGAGRRRVEAEYAHQGLATRLAALYRRVAEGGRDGARARSGRLLRALGAPDAPDAVGALGVPRAPAAPAGTNERHPASAGCR